MRVALSKPCLKHRPRIIITVFAATHFSSEHFLGTLRDTMREVVKFFVLLMAVCAIAVGASIVLPPPDGGVFAYTVLLSAIAVALIICSDLSKGRINDVGDIMRAIEKRKPLRLTIAAYLLGCSMVASATVLLYRIVGHW